VGVRVPPFAWPKVFFLNGDQNEEKKRDPRLLEEKERTAASFGTRSHQAPAACTAPRAAGEIWKAARNVDEIGPPGIVIGSHHLGLPRSFLFRFDIDPRFRQLSEEMVCRAFLVEGLLKQLRLRFIA
jgi:hypothetical protein